MKAIGLAVLAAVAIGCNGTTLTSPTVANGAGGITAAQDVRPDHTAGTTKVTLYFYSDDTWNLGMKHVTGMPVMLASVPAAVTREGTTGRQASISIDVPKGTTAVTWEVQPNSLGYCPTGGQLSLPYGVRENWFPVHLHPDCVVQ